MKKIAIKNFSELAISKEREIILNIAEAGYAAINTEKIIRDSVKLQDQSLSVGEKTYNLKSFEKLFVICIGKVASIGAEILEDILKEKITSGVAIGLKSANTKFIKSFQGSHPLPSKANVLAGHKLVELLENISEKDLVVCLVSGGGSALLCWPEDEYTQGKKLYEDFLKTGGDIKELNTVRKHLSSLKGGGLAKMLYPATVATLVFSDVPGNSWSSIASGPTYKDQSTIQDAQSVLDKYKLSGFKLSETPKENKYFEKIYNFQAVSNTTLLSAIKKAAESLNIPCNILSSEIYSDAPNLLKSFLKNIRPGEILLGAGEMKVTVTKTGGTGGRCQYLGMQALNKLNPNDTFAALSSDGLDNSDVAGIILDGNSSKEALNKNLKVETYLENFNGYEFFKQLGKSQVFTEATEANVSDFYIFYRKPQD